MFYHFPSQMEKIKTEGSFPDAKNPLVVLQNKNGFRVLIEGNDPSQRVAVEYCQNGQPGQEKIRIINLLRGSSFFQPTQEQLRATISSVDYNLQTQVGLEPEVRELLQTGKGMLEQVILCLEKSDPINN